MENREKRATRVGFVSLGCPKNQVDTEVMLASLASAGYEITPEETEADIVVINTCAFIQSAKEEAIDNILDIAWLKKKMCIRDSVVDFRPNFDNKLKEPKVLPSRFPNLLVNGSVGIAVGMATYIPPHNLSEVIDGTIYYMDHPRCV